MELVLPPPLDSCQQRMKVWFTVYYKSITVSITVTEVAASPAV